MSRLVLILAFLPLYLKAATDTTYAVDTTALKNLYSIISQKMPPNESGSFRWEHRRILYQALGIDSAHPDAATAMVRLRFGWRQLQDVRISQPNEPVVYFSQVLRLALHHGYGPVLLDAARWKIDMNGFDPATRSSLLDYLEEEYRNGTDEQRWAWLREYKQILLGTGASYYTETNFIMRNLAKKYDRIRPPVDGAYPVQKNGKWGWVDQHNKVLVPLRYKAVRYFTGELFEVSDNGSDFTVFRKPSAR